MPVRTAKATDLESLDAVVEPRALTGLDQPLWLQNSTYPAALDRALIASALETGVLGAGELAVTQRGAGANMSVDVAPGRVVVPMTDAPNQGSALCRSTAVNNLTVTGAPGAGLSRIDLVIARVYDASLIGGSINGWQLEIVTGTPASSPAAPASPVSSLVLAQIAVAAGQATVTNANITDRRVSGGSELAYAELTSSLTVPPNTPGSPQTVIALGSTNLTGSPVIVEFFAPVVTVPQGLGLQVQFLLWDGNTELGIVGHMIGNAAGYPTYGPVFLRRRITPTPGAHTYSVRAFVSAGAGNASIGAGSGGAGAYLPAYLRVTRAT